jgi:hypothetical protein
MDDCHPERRLCTPMEANQGSEGSRLSTMYRSFTTFRMTEKGIQDDRESAQNDINCQLSTINCQL